MSDPVIRLSVKLHFKPEHADLFATMIAPALASIRAEPGCLAFNPGRSRADRSIYVIHEEWASQADLDRHQATPGYQAMATRFPDLLAAPPEVHALEPLAPAR